MKYIRLNKHANNFDEVVAYYQDRARQLLYSGFIWTKGVQEVEHRSELVGAKTSFVRGNDFFVSYYLYDSFRGKGLYKQVTAKDKETKRFITVDDCDLETFFKENNYAFSVAKTCPSKSEICYKAISDFYGSRCAERSGKPYMNHIDEGIYILRKLGADHDTISGYILHPLFQSDDDFNTKGKSLIGILPPIPTAFALEYRNIANAYLAKRTIEDVSEIAVSPLEQVNTMLVADKIQNYKDLLANKNIEKEKRQHLQNYFFNWFERLETKSPFVSKTIREIEQIEIY